MSPLVAGTEVAKSCMDVARLLPEKVRLSEKTPKPRDGNFGGFAALYNGRAALKTLRIKAL